MEQCLRDLLKAVSYVHPKYYKTSSMHFMPKEGALILEDQEEYNINRAKIVMQACENSFTAELYHQYRNIIDDQLNYTWLKRRASSRDYYFNNIWNESYYNNLYLNFDINKMFHYTDPDSRFCRPDLVLHGGQDNMSIQKMIIEVKASVFGVSRSALQNDLKKLQKGIGDGLKFEYGVFINVNSSFNNIKDQIAGDGLFHRLTSEEKCKLFLINIFLPLQGEGDWDRRGYTDIQLLPFSNIEARFGNVEKTIPVYALREEI